jgi:splicing factor 3B subunit 1
MNESDDVDPFAETANSRQVSSRESEYQRRRFDRGEGVQGPSLCTPLPLEGTAGLASGLLAGDLRWPTCSAEGALTAFPCLCCYTRAARSVADGTNGEGSSYAETMRLRNLERDEELVARARADRERQDEEAGIAKKGAVADDATPPRGSFTAGDQTPPRGGGARAGDDTPPAAGRKGWGEDSSTTVEEQPKLKQESEEPTVIPRKRRSRWDETPAGVEETPGGTATTKKSRWDQTPVAGVSAYGPNAVASSVR